MFALRSLVHLGWNATEMDKLIYRDGSREVWEHTDETGKIVFEVITPQGCFFCGSESEAHYKLNRAGFLEMLRKEVTNGVSHQAQR